MPRLLISLFLIPSLPLLPSHSPSFSHHRFLQYPCLPAVRAITIAAATVTMTMSTSKSSCPALLLTNDDGLDPSVSLLVKLARHLRHAHWMSGMTMVVVTPGSDESACGMRISLGDKGLIVRRRIEVEHSILYRNDEGESNYGKMSGNGAACDEGWNGPGNNGGMLGEGEHGSVYVYEVEKGSPTDCVILALDEHGILRRLNLRARMLVSGLNVGSNLGSDVLFSGTFSAARQAGMYGVPAIAASFVGKIDEDNDRAIVAAVQVARSLFNITLDDTKDGGTVREAWKDGRVVVNVNVPKNWGGKFASARLGKVWYRQVVTLKGWKTDSKASVDMNGMRLTIGGGVADFHREEGSDFLAIERRQAAVSTLQTWPCTHPLALSDAVLLGELALTSDNGLPSWMESQILSQCASKSAQAGKE